MSVKKHLVEISLYAFILIGGTAVLLSIDAFEYLHRLLLVHESYELDELLLSVPLLLICLIIYSFRRSLDLADRNRKLVQSGDKLQAAYDRIRALSESREKFMAIACHELKGPLASVATALDLARQAESEEEAGEMLDHARKSLGQPAVAGQRRAPVHQPEPRRVPGGQEYVLRARDGRVRGPDHGPALPGTRDLPWKSPWMRTCRTGPWASRGGSA